MGGRRRQPEPGIRHGVPPGSGTRAYLAGLMTMKLPFLLVRKALGLKVKEQSARDLLEMATSSSVKGFLVTWKVTDSLPLEKVKWMPRTDRVVSR